MSYEVEYIKCRICKGDNPKFLGIRGNLEHYNAPSLGNNGEHMVTNTVQCRRCGFVYTNPLIITPAEKKVRFYDEPDEYSSSVHDKDPIEIFNRTLDILEKHIKHRGKLLDIGSGKGEFLAAAKKRRWEVSGIEPSNNFVNYSRKKYGLDIKNTDLESANFPDDYFDAITLNMVLEHVENPHRLMAGINKVLKQNGLLFIEVPNMDSWLLRAIGFYYKFHGKDWSPLLSPLHHPFHCYGYQKSSLKLLCKMNNFKMKKIYVLGIGLRGFRHDNESERFKKLKLNLFANIFSLMNKGDILFAIAIKN